MAPDTGSAPSRISVGTGPRPRIGRATLRENDPLSITPPMSDESRFDADADREPLDEQTVTEDEPPPGAEPVASGGDSAGEDDEDDEEDRQQKRERRRGAGEPAEPGEDEA